MTGALLERWRGLAPRERRMVAAAAIVVLLAIVHLALFEPAWNGRARLTDEIPRLRAQLAQMRALAAEARQLSAAPRSADSPRALRGALEKSIEAAGLGVHLAQLNASGDLFDLRFASVPHAAWLEWLDTTLRETGLRVADASITRESAPGIVSARLVLEAPRREGR